MFINRSARESCRDQHFAGELSRLALSPRPASRAFTIEAGIQPTLRITDYASARHFSSYYDAFLSRWQDLLSQTPAECRAIFTRPDCRYRRAGLDGRSYPVE